MKKKVRPITINRIRKAHAERRAEIRGRLDEFEEIRLHADDRRLWEEMVYCFFTGGCSARMGLRSLEAVKPILMTGDHAQLANALSGVHRYPNARADFVAESRKFLQEHFGLRLREQLESFDCRFERRDWLVKEKRIKGLGYKEASHYLRNIGFKGYAILDKHVLNCLVELKIIESAKPPNSRSRYLSTEEKLKTLTQAVGIDFDEMDLVLWSMKTGAILK